MCDATEPVRVKVSADLNCSGKEEWKSVKIDSCIADIVKSLQEAGIDMRGSCCGHDEREGYIYLADGRALLVLSRENTNWYFTTGIPLLREDRAVAQSDKSLNTKPEVPYLRLTFGPH